MAILIKPIDKEIERKLLTGFIVSTAFTNKVWKMARPEFWQVEAIRIAATWVLEYYKEYSEAPGAAIQDIYDRKKRTLNEANAQLLALLFKRINEEYEQGAERFNSPLLVDEAREYFDKRSLEVRLDQAFKSLEDGNLKNAKQVLDAYQKVSYDTSAVYDPFDVERIKQFDIEDEENRLVYLPGALGEMVGWLKRGWLVSMIGIEKRGKSWWLLELAYQCVMAGLNVLLVSLEMGESETDNRIYRRLTGRPDEFIDELVVPIMDCEHNQYGNCDERLCTSILLGESGDFPDPFDIIKDYKVCTKCRRHKDQKMRARYKPAFWYKKFFDVAPMTNDVIAEKAEGFRQIFGGKLRCRQYPAYSANSEDINLMLDEYKSAEGIDFDVVLIDYLEILDKEKGASDERANVDMTFKKFKGLAQTRKALYITVEQSRKDAYDRRSIRFSDTSEDKRKNAHIDVKLALNQTEEEEGLGIMRIGMLAHRHRRKPARREVLVLQQLDLAQPFLDSEWI